MTEPTGHGHGRAPQGQGRAASHGARSLGGSTADRNIVVFGLGLLFCALLIAVLPDLSPAQTGGLISERAHGRVTALLATGDLVAPQASVLVLDGARKGDTITAILESPTSQAAIPNYQPGDDVLVAIDVQTDGTITYSVVDRWRTPILLTIVGALALLTIAIAGWRGLRALTSLTITVVVVVRLLIPLLLNGYSPVALAVGLGILITVLSLLMTQGISRPTFAAIAGTAVGLVVTGILAVVVSSAAQFTSAQGSEEVAVIAQIAGNTIDLSGLLLAAVIFGGLGVLNDVAITQAVTIDEFRSIDPTMSRRELYRRAMSVGTAHLAATVNTLVFAYLGAALPVIVLLALQIHRLDLAVNDEHIAVEVVRTVVGAIGVLSAVPLTTAIAAWWAGAPGRPATTPRWVMALPLAGSVADATGRAVADMPTTDPSPGARTSGRAGALRRLLPTPRRKAPAPDPGTGDALTGGSTTADAVEGAAATTKTDGSNATTTPEPATAGDAETTEGSAPGPSSNEDPAAAAEAPALATPDPATPEPANEPAAPEPAAPEPAAPEPAASGPNDPSPEPRRRSLPGPRSAARRPSPSTPPGDATGGDGA